MRSPVSIPAPVVMAVAAPALVSAALVSAALVSAALVSAALVPAPALAATIHVPGQASTIQAGLVGQHPVPAGVCFLTAGDPSSFPIRPVRLVVIR